MRPIRISDGEGATMVALHDAGVRPAYIAAYTGRTPNGVTGWLKRNGGYTSRRMSAEECAEIERLYYDGLSIEQVAQAVGRTHGGVRYYLKQRDLFLPERTHVTPAMSVKMQMWYERGVPVAAIAARLGVGEGTIYNHVPASRRRQMTDGQVAAIVASYTRGDYVGDIARVTGWSERAIRDSLKSAGVYAPGQSPRRKAAGWHHHEDRIFSRHAARRNKDEH